MQSISTLPQQSEPAVQCKPAIPSHYVSSPEAPISQLRFRRVHGVDIDLTSVPVVKLQNFHSLCRLLYATMKENSQPDVVASTMIGDLSNTLLLDGVICYFRAVCICGKKFTNPEARGSYKRVLRYIGW